MTRKLNNDSSNQLELNDIPPQATDVEEVVLGAMLLEPQCIDSVLAIIKPESFYKEANQLICSAIAELHNQHKPLDILAVSENLKVQGKLEEIGGAYYLTTLTDRIASSAHVESHARIVQDRYILRELIRLSALAQAKAYELTDPLEIISSLNGGIDGLLSENQTGATERINSVIRRRVAAIEEISRNKSALIGIPSGLVTLDKSTGGWQNTDLIIIAARPSQGKTAFALFLALQAAGSGFPVAFFSLEMSKDQLIDRALSAMTTLSPLRIRSGRMDWPELESGIASLEGLPFYIDDTPALTLTQLRAKIMQLRKFGIKMVVVDYLQLMIGHGDNREQEIASLSRGLKALAKEINIPVIVLSQLNRAADGKRPMLSNLRESGAIEQDADIVIFIHRPEKYGQTENEGGRQTKGLVELIIDKHRNGPTGLLELYTNEFCTKFNDQNFDIVEPVKISPF